MCRAYVGHDFQIISGTFLSSEASGYFGLDLYHPKITFCLVVIKRDIEVMDKKADWGLVLHKLPEDVSWAELHDFIRWLQKEKQLSDRTINHCISQLRFFTMYVLHRPWDPTQLPMRRFDTYLPYVPSQKEVWDFIQSSSDSSQNCSFYLYFFSRYGDYSPYPYSKPYVRY